MQDVKDTVPKEQLLVHHARDGWEPLCDFLRVPIPDFPYPNVNDSAAMKRQFKIMQIVGTLILPGIPLLLAVLFAYFNF